MIDTILDMDMVMMVTLTLGGVASLWDHIVGSRMPAVLNWKLCPQEILL